MKIIQITDAHLVPDRQDMHGVNPYDRFTACIRHVQEHHSDAALCVISGDLAHKGQAAVYREMAEILSGLTIPLRLMIGNHDIRRNLLDVFPDTPTDGKGFIQSSLDLDAGRLIFLDTVEEGKNHGRYCQDRAEWLSGELDRARDRPVYLFLHHPPFELGLPNMDAMRLNIGDALLAKTLDRHDNIRHLFFGHIHRPTAGSWRGIPFSSIRGTAHQVAFRMDATPKLVRSHEPPAYAVILLDPETTVVHMIDFADTTAFVAP